MGKIRKNTPIQVGLWKNADDIQALWFDEKNQPHFLNHSLNQSENSTPLQIAKDIAAKLTAENATLKVSFKFITAISPKHIWSKSLILPHHLSSADCEQQCRYVLEQELPVPLEELWFDFCSKPLKQGFRLDIFAIMQQIAKQHIEGFYPLKINVLDNQVHCLLRAFQYFQPQLNVADTLLLYQDSEGCLAIQQKPHQLQILQTQENLTALFDQFCQRYEEKPASTLVYRTTHNEILPDDWQEIRTDLPFMALGAARWQQDFTNDER